MLAIYHSTTQRRKHSNVKEPSWTNVNIAGESDGTESHRRKEAHPPAVAPNHGRMRSGMCHAARVLPMVGRTDVCENECGDRVRFLRRPDAMAAERRAGGRQVRCAETTVASRPSGCRPACGPQEAIVAPADGVIAFSGNVGGKAVVTIRHGGDLSGLTSTFEPAIAERDVGAHVAQGERFARVEGESDHCDERCLHWGIKSEGRQYTNPESKTRTVRIGLKGL